MMLAFGLLIFCLTRYFKNPIEILCEKNIWRKIFAKLPFLAARALEELSLLKQKKEIPKRGYISKTAPEVQTTMALLNLNMENHTAENTDTTVVVETTLA